MKNHTLDFWYVVAHAPLHVLSLKLWNSRSLQVTIRPLEDNPLWYTSVCTIGCGRHKEHQNKPKICTPTNSKVLVSASVVSVAAYDTGWPLMTVNASDSHFNTVSFRQLKPGVYSKSHIPYSANVVSFPPYDRRVHLCQWVSFSVAATLLRS